MGIFQRSWIDRYRKSDRLPVKVTRVSEDGKVDLVPWLNPVPVNFQSYGYVVRFLEKHNESRFEYFAAFVEIFPGVQGFLHWGNAKEAGINLDDLHEGDSVHIRVISPASGKNRCELELIDASELDFGKK